MVWLKMADLLSPFSFVPPKNTQEKNDLGDSATPDVCVQTRNALIRDANALISKVQSKSRPPERAVINGPALHPLSALCLQPAVWKQHFNFLLLFYLAVVSALSIMLYF